LGSTVPTPKVDDDGELIVRKQMKVSLSCDHRVIDGAGWGEVPQGSQRHDGRSLPGIILRKNHGNL
jgi:hypothetical protein